jgi:hypothetical protein
MRWSRLPGQLQWRSPLWELKKHQRQRLHTDSIVQEVLHFCIAHGFIFEENSEMQSD